MITLRTLDAHTAGEPLRLIVDGFPRVEGRTMLERREWVRANCDHLRTALMLEPRGHADMYGALLTEPERPDSDAGVLFMHNEGYSTMCGHGVIAVVTMAIERGLIVPRSGSDVIVLDAPAGQIRARAETRRDGERIRVERVSFVNVPSFTLCAALPVRLGNREVACRRGVWRRLLRDCGCRVSRHGRPARAPRRPAARRHGDQARGRSHGAGGSSARA